MSKWNELFTDQAEEAGTAHDTPRNELLTHATNTNSTDDYAENQDATSQSRPLRKPYNYDPRPRCRETLYDYAGHKGNTLYLDFLVEQDLQDVIVVGCSLGGWIAAEMAVKCTERVSKLILVTPLGIKVGDRETRDIPDIFALPFEEVSDMGPGRRDGSAQKTENRHWHPSLLL